MLIICGTLLRAQRSLTLRWRVGGVALLRSRPRYAMRCGWTAGVFRDVCDPHAALAFCSIVCCCAVSLILQKFMHVA